MKLFNRDVAVRHEPLHRPRGRLSRALHHPVLAPLLGVGLLLVVALALLAADLVAYRHTIHPRVGVSGASLGGLSPADAETVLEGAAQEVGRRRVRFRWQDREFETTLAEAGWRPAIEATAASAFRVGRSGSLWERVIDRAGAWLDPVSVAWKHGWDRRALSGVIDEWEEAVGRPAVEGQVSAQGSEIRRRDPAPGRGIDADRLQALAARAVAGPVRAALPLPIAAVAPVTTTGDVDRAVQVVEGLLSGPVDVTAAGASLRFAPEELGPLVRTTVEGTGEDARLRVTFPTDRVEALFAPHLDAIESAPRDASFQTSGGGVSILPAAPGRRLDLEVAAKRLLRIARSDDRSGTIPLAEVEASFTTAEARELGIVELVSEFTTHHEPGEPRVTNIHLAADVLDGTIVWPGGTFSLNGTLGQRTRERGFVEAPAIYDGKFVQSVGGGISQLATTTFNAIFFGGYPIDEYKAHTYYISRYPEGREATVSWPKPDLIFRNDTAAGILIETEYTDTSITVRFYGNRSGRTVRATKPVVVGRDSSGYTVLVKRIIEEDGGQVRTEEFRTYYRYGGH